MRVFVHGLGQTPDSWRQMLACLGDETAACPQLSALIAGQEVCYANLYRAFCAYCDALEGPLELCGLSLGAMLALDYALEHPQRVRRLAVIAPQVKPPKLLMKLQSAVFHLLPDSAFEEIGLPRQDFIRLTSTTAALDFTGRLSQIACPALVLCGERDKVNRKAARQTAADIPGAQLAFIPQAGHEVNIDAPQMLAQRLAPFFA